MTDSDLNPVHEERQKQLNRYNRLTIYLPLALMALVIVAIVGTMMWLVLAGDESGIANWREFTSATADLIIILTVLPMILIMALFPILAGVWIWYTWENRYPVETWLQGWFRKSDTFVGTNSGRVNQVAKSTANVSITYRASVTQIGRIAEQSFSWLFPSALKTSEEESNE